MLREQTLLEEKLIKYNKIKDRWNKVDVTIKITGTNNDFYFNIFSNC